jgi:hypothetical protein
MPDAFKSSITIVSNRRLIRWSSLCAACLGMFASRARSRESRNCRTIWRRDASYQAWLARCSCRPDPALLSLDATEEARLRSFRADTVPISLFLFAIVASVRCQDQHRKTGRSGDPAQRIHHRHQHAPRQIADRLPPWWHPRITPQNRAFSRIRTQPISWECGPDPSAGQCRSVQVN